MDGQADPGGKNRVSNPKPPPESLSSRFLWYILQDKALFSCNLIQGGIFEGLMCWGVFFSLGILHYLNFKDTDAKKRAIGDCIFYAILVAWIVGTVVHYGFIY